MDWYFIFSIFMMFFPVFMALLTVISGHILVIYFPRKHIPYRSKIGLFSEMIDFGSVMLNVSGSLQTQL